MADPLDLISYFESGNRNVPNYRYDKTHTAGGNFQITDTNWRKYAPELGAGNYPNAMAAPYDTQRAVAQRMFNESGYAPWAPYNPALAKAIGWKGAYQTREPASGANVLHFDMNPQRATEMPPPALLDRLLGGGQQPDAAGADEASIAPLAFLDRLLGGGAQQQPAQTGTQPPQPELAALDPAPLETPGPIPDLKVPDMQAPEALLDKMLSDAVAAKPEPASARLLQPGIEASAPALLDRLLGMGDPEAQSAAAASSAMEPITGGFAKGVGEGLFVPGEDLRGRLEGAGGPEVAGAALGRVPGGLFVEPIRGGGQALEATQKGEPVSPQEMFTAATPAITGGIAPRGSLASGLGRGPGFAPARPPTGAVGKAVNTARETINGIFSPTTVDPFSREAESLIRQSTGLARRSTEQANAAMEPHRPLVNQHVPEFDAWMRLDPGARATAPEPALLQFLDFVETRSGGGTKYTGPAELKPLADELRRVYREREMAIAAEPTTEGASFIEDYYSHVWKDKARARTLTAGTPPRTGSGSSLKERTVPTISEGIRRGLVPASLDPIETTMRYIANMDRFLAHNRVFRIGRESGAIQVFPPGGQPEGWTALKGRLATTPGGQAYAPEAFARVYNNAIDSGVYADRLGGAVYSAAMAIKNSINSMVLGFPGFHASAMAQEATASVLARAAGDLTEGEMLDAFRRVGLQGMPIAKSVDDVLRTGKKLQRQYLGIDDYGPDWEKVAKSLAEGGGRIIGRGDEWRGTAADNFFKAWKRGSLKIDALSAARDIGERPLHAPAIFAREIARIMDTIGSPVFDVMIPRLKAAAFFDEMYAWQQKNPLASRGEQLAKSRELVDVVDDRFGELIMDNLFWGKRTKQVLQLVTTSLGWELGTLRSGLGAGADVLRGKWSPRVRYIIGLAGAIGIYNAAYEYLKTGKGPQDATDLIAPRTGGKTPEGAPERALLPGYEKDALGYWHDPVGEFLGKLSPAGRLATEMGSGKDYFGHEIAPYPQGTPEWFKAWAKHIIQGATPIPLKQDTLRGSNIGTAERWLGAKPAPEYVQNPQRADDMEMRRRLNDLRSELRGLYAHGRRTTQTPQELEDKAREIRRAIEQTQRDSDARRRKRQGTR